MIINNMKKKYLIISGLLLVVVAASVFALLKLNSSSENSENLGRPLALLRELQNEVRHKHSGDFFWKDSTDGKKVYDGSQIFVGPRSSALLVFSENRKARLNAETLLRLTQVGQNPSLISLRINDGGFNLKSNKNTETPIVLNLEDGKFKVSSQAAYDIYVKKADGRLALSVAAGKVSLEGVLGKTELDQGHSVVLKERITHSKGTGSAAEAEVFAEELPTANIKLLAPSDGEVLRQQPEPLFFKWQVAEKSPLYLQYSSLPDFSDNFKEIEVTGQEFFPIPVAELKNDVFWRMVIYRDGVPSFSKVAFFKIGRTEAIKLKTAPLAFIRKGNWKLETTVVDEDRNSNYEFQVSKVDTFATLHDAFVGHSPFSSLLDSPGDFYLRARKSYGNGLFTGWSTPEKVTVRESMAAPVIEISDRKEDTAGNVITEFKWAEVPNADSYTVQASNFPSFEPVNYQKSVKTVTTSMKHSSPKKVYYRVFARSIEGEMSPASNTAISEGSSIIKEQILAEQESAAQAKPTSAASATAAGAGGILPPTEYNTKLLLPLDGTVFYAGDMIKFEWDPFFVNPTVEVSTVQNFSQDVERFVSGNKPSISIGSANRKGRHFWRLAFEQTPGKVEYTKSQGFIVSEAIPTQIQKLTLNFLERGKWNMSVKIKDAKDKEEFVVQTTLDPTFQKIEHEFTGPLTQLVPLTKPGTYYVRAHRARGSARMQAWSNTMTQFLRPPLEAPSLTKQQEVLASPEVITIKLDWKDVKYATQYLVQIDNTDGFGVVKRSFRVPENTYNLEHSQKDPSFVRVVAQSAEGELSPPSNVFRIKGLLPGPSIEKYEIMYADIDKKNDQDRLHILWTHRKNTKKYIVELSRTEDLKQFQKFETENIEFFTPVKDTGWYYFRVRPESSSPDFFYSPTTVFAVEYKKIGALQEVKVEQPRNGDSFAYNNGKYVVQFRWGQTLGAGWYELEMAQSNDFKDSKIHKVEARDYRLPPGLKSGTWYYRLRGRNPNQASPWSETQSLNLR
ncbi:MAG: hypothetical protein J7501_09650 [Bdellovibrio sp.]|nr:hypothetical protein [Bdellovibrio sp.]